MSDGSGAEPSDVPPVQEGERPAAEPRHHTVRVRRSPKVGVFLGLGAIAGALVAFLFIAVSPVDPQVPTPQALGFLVLLLAPVGALVGGGVAVVIDGVGERRAREVQAERLGPDEDDHEG